MSENNENLEVQEPVEENAVEKTFTVPVAVIPITAGLVLDGLYHVGKFIITFGIKVGKAMIEKLRKSDETQEPEGFPDYESSIKSEDDE